MYYSKELLKDRYSRDPPLSDMELIVGIMGHHPNRTEKQLSELFYLYRQLSLTRYLLRHCDEE